MSELPTLTLSSACLLSKWGFNDGDSPEHLLDYWDDHNVAYSQIPWDEVLRILVKRHLLPELAKSHEIELYEVETIHNPVRAIAVDGKNVEACWYHEAPCPDLSPEHVEVSYEEIMAAVAEAQQ